MKKLLASLILPVLLWTLALLPLSAGSKKSFSSYENKVSKSEGALYADGKFHCSGTEIGHTADGGGLFLTARHCVADPYTSRVIKDLAVTFSDDEMGPFYRVFIVAISIDDDIALLQVVNGGDVPEIPVRDERSLKEGAPIFNVSYPLDAGKLVFHGEYMGPKYPHVSESLTDSIPMWTHAMPINISIAHGSSGGGLFSTKKKGLIGIAVGGSGESSFNIGIPSDRIIDFLNDLKDNTVEKFQVAHPVLEDPMYGPGELEQ